MARAAGFLLLGVLAGCSSTSSMNPVNWWHGLQGGRIAEERPAPPGAEAPYPNLSTVPARPAPPDRDAMKRLTESLIGDRSNAQYTAEAAPLADPSSPSASPGLFGAGTLPPPPPAPPPGSAAAGSSSAPLSASLPAASAPPPPAAPPSPAPLRPVQSQPLEAPTQPVPAQPAEPDLSSSAAVTQPAGASVASAPVEVPAVSSAPVSSAPVSSPPVSSTAADATPLPELPTAPPPRAAAAPPPPPPAPQPLPASPAAQGGVILGFAPGSSQLSPTAADDVKRFLAGRVGQPIAVTGFGDATSADPGAQTAAVSLALTRAQAVVNALTAAGVPRTAISIGAEAGGRGASLRLLQ